jgi:hypothetical protein
VQILGDVTRTSYGEPLASEAGSAPSMTPEDAMAYSLQLIGGGWITSRDLHVLGARHQRSDRMTLTSAAWYARFPLGRRWRLGPRLRADEQRSGDAASVRYAPSLRLDFVGQRTFFLLEAGAELGQRELAATTQDTTRYFVLCEYRWSF